MEDLADQFPGFTGIERLIMQSVWAGHKRSRAIYDAMPEADRRRLAFSTISTYLMRMVQKGYLKRSPTETREFEFTPLVTEDSAAEKICRDLSGIPKHKSIVLRRLAGDNTFNEEERRLLQKLAEKVKKQGQ